MNTDSRLNTPLEAFESVLWCGQPHQGKMSREGDRNACLHHLFIDT